MGYIVQTLLSNWGAPLLHSFSPLLLLEQAQLMPAIEKFLVFLAKLETVAFVAIMPLHCSTLEPIPYSLFFPLTSLLLFYFPSSSYSKQLSYYTIVQLKLVAILTS